MSATRTDQRPRDTRISFARIVALDRGTRRKVHPNSGTIGGGDIASSVLYCTGDRARTRERRRREPVSREASFPAFIDAHLALTRGSEDGPPRVEGGRPYRRSSCPGIAPGDARPNTVECVVTSDCRRDGQDFAPRL